MLSCLMTPEIPNGEDDSKASKSLLSRCRKFVPANQKGTSGKAQNAGKVLLSPWAAWSVVTTAHCTGPLLRLFYGGGGSDLGLKGVDMCLIGGWGVFESISAWLLLSSCCHWPVSWDSSDGLVSGVSGFLDRLWVEEWQTSSKLAAN